MTTITGSTRHSPRPAARCRHPGGALSRGAATLALLVALAAPARAVDSVQLHTGELFTGEVLRSTPKEVSIKLDSGGIITFKTTYVKRVRRWVPGQEAPEVTTYESRTADDTGSAGGTSGATPGTSLPILRPYQPDPSKHVDGAISRAPLEHLAADPATQHWALDLPPGFEPMDVDDIPEVVRVWKDPVVQASAVLTAQPLDLVKPEQRKRAVIKEIQSAPGFRLIRDQEIQRGGDGGYRGWLLEVEHALAGAPVRVLQLFTANDERTFVLTYSCTLQDYPSLARFFEESMASFRLEKPAPPATDTPREPGVTLPKPPLPPVR